MTEFPSLREEDFFLRLPQIEFDTSAVLAHSLKQLPDIGFLTNNIAKSDVMGAFLPDELIDPLNRRVRYSDTTFRGLSGYLGHAPEPLFTHPAIFVLHPDGSSYNLHTDTMRPSSLNFLILGEGEDHTTYFEWYDSSIGLTYVPNQATLFNTQIPHRVSINTASLRILLTVRCSIGYQQFSAFLKKGFIETGK